MVSSLSLPFFSLSLSLFLSYHTARNINMLPKKICWLFWSYWEVWIIFWGIGQAAHSAISTELCLLMELSLWAIVAADVYLQLVGASVMLFCISSWKYPLNRISRNIEIVLFVRPLKCIFHCLSHENVWIKSSEDFKYRNFILWVFTQVVQVFHTECS